MRFPDFKNELESLAQGYSCVLGCDEVGVAPLAGPVVAAACILDPKSIGKYRSKNKWYCRVRDSKTVNEAEREKLLGEILKHTLCYGVGEASPAEIDELNIHHATLLAMRRAVESLMIKLNCGNKKSFLFIDGRFKIPELSFEMEQKAVIDGDAKILSISAASIIAKVHRDGIMRKFDQDFPEYGFAKHKGYPTREHRQALSKYGPCQMHRQTFIGKIFEQV